MTPVSKDVIKISYCRQHKIHWVWNCPECMAHEVETETLKAVGEWLEQCITLSTPTRLELDLSPEWLESLKQGEKPWGESGKSTESILPH